VPAEERHNLRLVTVGHHFFETLGVAPVAGRTFERGRAADSSAVVLNRAAFERLAQDLPPDQRTLAAAVGRSVDVSVGGLGGSPELIGVVEDLHLATLHQPIEPMAFFLDPTLLDTYYLRVDASRMTESLADLETVWHQFFPNAPFAYEFADQSFAAAYRADRRTASLIGVRKAVGASAAQIVGLLSTDFLQLVGVAILVAVPVAYVILGWWLDTFAYHFDLGPGLFLSAGAGALLVALVTVSTQALRAARVDPAATLRDE
jgi:putative ABC transport system permease protein